MESNVRTKLAEALLKDLSSDENKRTRKKLQKARPQVLFLENLNFINGNYPCLLSFNPEIILHP